MSIKIMIADDHKILREGLKSLIQKEPQMEVTGEADNGRDIVNLVTELEPDIVIMDISMSGLNGIEATRKILSINKNVKIIGLSMHPDRQYILELLKAGGMGYIIKETTFDELVRAIKNVYRGNKYLSSTLVPEILEDFLYQNEESQPFKYSRLSEREREIMQMPVEGKSSKEIAFELKLASRTVDKHKSNIMQKLEIYNIPDLTRFAIKEGLTTLQRI